MTMARWEQTITDDRGNIVPGAQVRVQREAPGLPLVALYADRGGTTPLGNPFTTGSDGIVGFHSRGGSFRITITKGSFTRVLRYAAIGLAQESDDSLNVDPAGAYDQLLAYARNSFVLNQTATWMARRDVAIGDAPPTLPTMVNDDWQWISGKGDPGNNGAGVVDNVLDVAERTTPSAPAAGTHQLYFKNDGIPRKQGPSGGEKALLSANDEDQGPITGGAGIQPKALGTITTGTVTIDVRDRAMQEYTNNGAHTLDAAANAGSTVVKITNGASAGAITTSGFDLVRGNSFTTTNGHVFRCTIEYWGSGQKWLFVERIV